MRTDGLVGNSGVADDFIGCGVALLLLPMVMSLGFNARKEDLQIGHICGYSVMRTTRASKGSGVTGPLKPQFSVTGLALIESHHGEGFFMEWRRDDFYKLVLVLEGKGSFQTRDVGAEITAIAAPMLLSVPRGTEHRFVDATGSPMTLYLLCLRPSVFPGTGLLDHSLGRIRFLEENMLVERSLAMLRQILFEKRNPGPCSEELSLALAMQLLVALARSSADSTTETGAEARVLAYGRELEHSFWVGESMDRVAARLGISRRNFSSRFRRLFGTTWLDRIHELRISHASRLLIETPLPVKSIAFECGYNDLSHFHRRFLAAKGTTPVTWRESRRVTN